MAVTEIDLYTRIVNLEAAVFAGVLSGTMPAVFSGVEIPPLQVMATAGAQAFSDRAVSDAQRLADFMTKLNQGGTATQSQLAQDRALLPDLRQNQAVARHALAILTGKAPAEWSPPDFVLLTGPWSTQPSASKLPRAANPPCPGLTSTSTTARPCSAPVNKPTQAPGFQDHHSMT